MADRRSRALASAEAVYQDRTKAVSIRDQQCDRRNAPHDAQHGKRAAGTVPLQRDPGFVNDFSQHGSSYSLLALGF